MQLKGKTAVITGGGGVIGMATAQRFVCDGARVALVDHDDVALAQAAENIGSGDVLTIRADVTKAADCKLYASEAVKHFGDIDIFFNNAGIEGVFAPLADFPEDVFDQVMDVNVKGVFLGLKYMMPVMRDGGSIIITSSTAGLRGSPHFAAYTASKHAVVGLMRTTAAEGAARRIRCNSIHPAMVDSNMMRRLEDQRMGNRSRADVQVDYQSKIPLGRYIKPEEIAALVAWLGSDDAAMITGTQQLADGGLMMG